MLRQFIIFIALVITACAACAGEAGRIVFVTGEAQASGRQLALGDVVHEGDELSTGANGYVYLKTIDEGFFILRPGSQARIVAYHIDAQNPANTHVKLELLGGVARTISGKGVKQARQNFRFNTPVAAIGVRGTDFTVFTDQETSRVAVISGGVVVSGFSGACGPEGAGPCEGGASRELFANQAGHLLQINKGQASPQLMKSSGSPAEFGPPPRNDEPIGRGVVSNPVAGSADFSLDPAKTNNLLSSKPSAPDGGGTVPPVVVPPVPPPVVQPGTGSEIVWGRWEAVAKLPADAVALAKLKAGGYDPANIVGSFFISRISNSTLVMPKDGQAAFALTGSEAYISSGGHAPFAAAVRDARLDVDFGTHAFSTSLSVVGHGLTVNLRAQGDVTSSGELVSNMLQSNGTVRGYLGGSGAQEAGYIFRTTDSFTLSAFGATSWGR